MATTKKVSQSKSQGKPAPKAPAEVLRDAKARIEEIHAAAPPPPRMSSERHPASDAAEAAGAARDEIRALTMPIELGDLCDIIGTDVHADDFASTALESIGDQIYTLAALVETDLSRESWRLFFNLSERTKLAGRIVTWLETETTEPAEVQS